MSNAVRQRLLIALLMLGLASVLASCGFFGSSADDEGRRYRVTITSPPANTIVRDESESVTFEGVVTGPALFIAIKAYRINAGTNFTIQGTSEDDRFEFTINASQLDEGLNTIRVSVGDPDGFGDDEIQIFYEPSSAAEPDTEAPFTISVNPDGFTISLSGAGTESGYGTAHVIVARSPGFDEEVTLTLRADTPDILDGFDYRFSSDDPDDQVFIVQSVMLDADTYDLTIEGTSTSHTATASFALNVTE